MIPIDSILTIDNALLNIVIRTAEKKVSNSYNKSLKIKMVIISLLFKKKIYEACKQQILLNNPQAIENKRQLVKNSKITQNSNIFKEKQNFVK